MSVADNCQFDQDVTKLQVRVWYSAIAVRSGLTKNELCRQFPSEPRPGAVVSGAYTGAESGYWDRISGGKILPLRRKHGRQLVDEVDARYPGTKRWIVCPLWELLRSAPISSSRIHEIFSGLHPAIRSTLLVEPDVTSVFCRRPPNGNPYKALDRIARLAGEDDEDAFARLMGSVVAVLALIREAEITQNQPQHFQGRRAWEGMVRRLEIFAEVSPLLEALVSLGKGRFQGTIYSPDGEAEMLLDPR